MRKEFRVLGIVLKKKKLKDRDFQVILFTKKRGKLVLLAKGAQKITSRRLPHLDTGNLIKARVIEKQDFLYLSETLLISGFSSIKENLKKTVNFFLVLKIIEKISPEKQKDEELFQFLLKTIKKIDEGSFEKDVFIENLVKLVGLGKDELLQMF